MTDESRQQLATRIDPAIVERVLLSGDLRHLTPRQKVAYYGRVCDSLGLNPLTQPFAYIVLNGKEQLYARRECTEQLRRRHAVTVQIIGREVVEGCYVVTARATLPDGRSDDSIGAVPIDGLKGEGRANAMMKAETKSKRRVTLSICGLGMLDESEVETIPDAQPLAFEPETGETTEPAEIPEPGNPAASWADKPSAVGETLKQALHATKGKPRDITPTPAKADIKPGKDVISEAQRKRLWATAKEHGWSDDQLKAWLLQQFGIESTKAIPWVKYDEIIQRLRQGPAGEQHPF